MRINLDRIQRSARRHPRWALRLYADLERRALAVGDSNLYLAVVYQRYFTKERLGEALEIRDDLYRGLQIAENKNLPLAAGQMLVALGRIHYTQGAYRDATRYWTRCIDLCKLTADTRSLVEARIGLGAIYDAIGDWETGARFHRDAGDLLSLSDDPYLLSKQRINLAINQRNIGHIENAKELFEQARDHAVRGEIAEYVAEAQWHLGALAILRGKLDEAEHDTRLALTLANGCGYQWLQGAARHTLANIYQLQELPELALNTYLEALQHATEINSRTQKLACCEALSRLYEKTGRIAEALNYARQAQSINAQLAELSASDSFRELREYDLSHKPPVELLLELSSNNHLENLSVEAALQHIVTAALEILRIEFVAIWLQDEDLPQLRCRALTGAVGTTITKESVLSAQQKAGYWKVLQLSQSPILAPDIRLHPAAAQLNKLFGTSTVRSLLEIPLRMNGTQLGAVSFGQTDGQRNWSREDVLFGSQIANVIQQVLGYAEHAKAQHELELHVTRRTQELQRQTENLELAHRNIYLLSELGREITTNLDRESIMDCVYRHVQGLMPAEVFAIGIYRAENGSIEFPCNYLHGKRMLPYQRDMQDSDLLAVWCIRHQREIFINDIRTEYAAFISEKGLNTLVPDAAYVDLSQKIMPLSHIYAPLRVKNKIIGLIAIQSSKTNAFQRMHVDMLMSLATSTAVALENADTYLQLSNAQQMLMSKEKLAALGSLVAGIAHELNTPLGNCLLTATTLQEQTTRFMRELENGTIKRSGLNQFTSSVASANEIVVRNLENASELVSSFKQVSVDQTSQQRRLFNLLDTSMDIIRTVQSSIQKQGHHIAVDIPAELNLNSYPGPYGQVITNLINNALLHAFEGRSDGLMQLSARRLNNDQVQIIFSDNGVGILAEHIRRIFDPFFTTKLGSGGSGLGMNIVHTIVTDLLGGEISVASDYGLGTQISLRLPLQS
ncbi:ATP-binding protein [Undibacterium sp. Ren11W]|uniref:ATP-binding protein n=1 Tax=Undibacterium sp. Ren11W TaxID=3413045 RepID=UPI003BF40861